MRGIQGYINEISANITLSATDINRTASKFYEEMQKGLADLDSSLKMLPAYLSMPTGQEIGEYIGLDFGGTNVRIVRAEIGNKEYKIVKKREFPLRDPSGKYDFTQPTTTGEKLFDYIAEQIEIIANKQGVSLLGYIFSFPCEQHSVKQAVLLNWTKEIHVSGVEGRDIGLLLKEALDRRGLGRIKIQAIINDTVGTLLAAAYKEPCTDIASICGTGHNTCYFGEYSTTMQKPMIINLEAGNFNQLSFTKFDNLIDANSERPGEQRLEKMVSGKYLGELLRLVLCDIVEQGGILIDRNTTILKCEKAIASEQVAAIIGDISVQLEVIEKILSDQLAIVGSSIAERMVIKEICLLIVKRSAQLTGATFLGILKHIDPALARDHLIAIHGSVNEKMPGYQEIIFDTLREQLGDNINKISIKAIKDGSVIGAAVAAAISQ